MRLGIYHRRDEGLPSISRKEQHRQELLESLSPTHRAVLGLMDQIYREFTQGISPNSLKMMELAWQGVSPLITNSVCGKDEQELRDMIGRMRDYIAEWCDETLATTQPERERVCSGADGNGKIATLPVYHPGPAEPGNSGR